MSIGLLSHAVLYFFFSVRDNGPLICCQTNATNATVNSFSLDKGHRGGIRIVANATLNATAPRSNATSGHAFPSCCHFVDVRGLADHLPRRVGVRVGVKKRSFRDTSLPGGALPLTFDRYYAPIQGPYIILRTSACTMAPAPPQARSLAPHTALELAIRRSLPPLLPAGA